MSTLSSIPYPEEDLPEVAPFASWLGLHIESEANGVAVLRLAPKAEFLNRRNVIHGGVLATMLDSAMARAARTIDGVTSLGGTTDLHIQFMRPGQGPLTAEGRVEHAAATLAFCRGEVRNAAGELVAAGSASLRLRRAARD